jgi:hypothetical protein
MASSIVAASGVARPDRPLRSLSALSFTLESPCRQDRVPRKAEKSVSMDRVRRLPAVARVVGDADSPKTRCKECSRRTMTAGVSRELLN